MLFDVLWWEGHPTGELAWSDRRVLLDSLELGGPVWSTPTAHVGDGADLVAAAANGVDALVAKHVDSRYRPGTASEDWVEVRLG